MTDLLAALLRGDAVTADVLAGLDPEPFFRALSHHSLAPLVAESLVGRKDLPETIGPRLESIAREHLATDLARERELRVCLDALHEAAVPVLLMKGAQLAYTHYPRPDLRPRADTDLLIPTASIAVVGDVLRRLGYTEPTHVTGDLVMSQATYLKRRGSRTLHAVDVHWRVANPQVFADYVSYDELAEHAVPIARLGAGARGLSDVHALLVACVHRVAHHYDSDCLIWLYDIHLLVSRMTTGDWGRFVKLAEARGVAPICHRSFERSIRHFGTSVAAWASGTSGPVAAPEFERARAAYLSPGRRHIQFVVSDLRALPRWADRWRLAKEHLIPPARYMRDVYAPSSGAPLPVLYAQRALRGARKWLFRSA